MKAPLTIILAFTAILPLSACSTLDKLTKQTDDTVLPGPREDAVPGRTQYPAEGEKPSTATATTATTAETPVDVQTTEEKKPCAADDPECLPPLTDSDTFSDGQ